MNLIVFPHKVLAYLNVLFLYLFDLRIQYTTSFNFLTIQYGPSQLLCSFEVLSFFSPKIIQSNLLPFFEMDLSGPLIISGLCLRRSDINSFPYIFMDLS